MIYIYGRKPVFEALKSGAGLEQVYLLKGTRGELIQEIEKYCKQNKVKLSQLPPQKFESIIKGVNTQGVIAFSPEIKMLSLNELLESVISIQNPKLLILEEIQDPHNLGALLRTAECSGIDGVIISYHNSAPISPTAVKTSAGAVSYLNICRVNNINQTIDILKQEGFWIYGTDLNATKYYSDLDFDEAAAVIFGNEEKGMSRLARSKCDFLMKIPMAGKIDSLNVSVSAGVILFDIYKKRISR